MEEKTINEYRELGIAIHYRNCNDEGVCPECRELATMIFTPSEAPKLPYSKCTGEKCRCWSSPFVLDAHSDEELNQLKWATTTTKETIKKDQEQAFLDRWNKEDERAKSWWKKLRGK